MTGPKTAPNASEVRQSYDAVALEYGRRISGELAGKPFDRELLDELTAAARGGPISDVGCGPGHVARYLRDQGASVCGIDLSPRMIEEARRRNPDIEFTLGDIRSLDVGDATFAAVVAFYSLIHLDRSDLLAALREVGRVLRPQGILAAAFHQGSAVEHVDEWFGSSVSLDVFFAQRHEIEEAVAEPGLKLERTIERPPYPGVEVETDRLYVVARRPT